MKKINIKVSKETIDKLKLFRKHIKQDYDEVINDVLDELNAIEDNYNSKIK